MRALRIHAAAVDEAVEAAAWYERERPGLGAEFERAIDAALDLLEEEIVPLTWVPGVAGARGVKRLILRRSRPQRAATNFSEGVLPRLING
jgi:toxin ParE1/3/4